MIGTARVTRTLVSSTTVAVGSMTIGEDLLYGANHTEYVGGFILLGALLVWGIAQVGLTAERRRLAARLAAAEETERRLERSEQRLSLAQRIARVGTWDDDLATGEARWTDTTRELYGVEPDAPAGYDAFIELVHPDDRMHVQRIVGTAIEHGGEFEHEHRLCQPGGDVRWFLSRGRVIVEPNGRSRRVIGAAMDITDLKRDQAERDKLEHKLRQAHKLEAVGRLAGGVAHDFNNLLLAIHGYADFALRAVDAGSDPRECLGQIVAAADSAGRLTKQLLAFSRRQVLRPENIALNDVVGDMEALLRRLIGEDVDLVAPRPTTDVHVEADRGQLEQVIANLAVNAREAMPEGGTLTLQLETATVASGQGLGVAPGDYAVLAVSDTGCGMDPETSARIFEPFFTTKETGNGLGLATVHGIVTQSGGSIWLYSELGQGTTFKIYLPLAEAQTNSDQVPAPARAADGQGEAILLVEDDDRVRAIVAEMLESRGYDVVRASNGDEACALASSGAPPELLVSDLVMPGIGGREVARRIRQLHPSVRVLHMSGYTDDDVIRRGALEPSAAFLEKPFTADDLSRRVRELLDLQLSA